MFETMAFPNDSYSEILCERYSTVEEAVKGHEEVVAYLLDNRLHFLVVNGLYIAKEREVVYKNPYIYGND